MPKESRVEIPQDSGNWYRYDYEDGQTLYKGPVGTAPAISEEEFYVAVHRGIADVKLARIRDKVGDQYPLATSIMVPVKTAKNPKKTVWINVKETDLESYFASTWAQVGPDDERGKYIEVNDINDINEKGVVVNEDGKWIKVVGR